MDKARVRTEAIKVNLDVWQFENNWQHDFTDCCSNCGKFRPFFNIRFETLIQIICNRNFNFKAIASALSCARVVL
jgi:hypothetical protein